MSTRTLTITAVLLIFAANATTAQNGQELFQQGQLKERGDRDLNAAIQIYERVWREFGSNRTLAAKALLQLAGIHGDLNQSKAIEYYDRVIKDYGDLPGLRDEAERRRKAIDRNTVADSMPDRRVWFDPKLDTQNAAVSFDGGRLAYIDKAPVGALIVVETRTGTTTSLKLPHPGEARSPAISRDGRFVAYSLHDSSVPRYELRVLDLETRIDRVLLERPNELYEPQDWTADGRILTLLSRNDGVFQIALVDRHGGLPEILKTFLTPEPPRNMTLSPDARYVAYDFIQDRNTKARDVFLLSILPGFPETAVAPHEALDSVLGWMPDSKSLLFASEREKGEGIWAVEIQEGRLGNATPLRVKQNAGNLHSLATTSSGSLVYASIAKAGEVRVLEGIGPELARLQVAAQQQARTQIAHTAAIEGVVVKMGTNEPITGVDIELVRMEGTPEVPLPAGFSEAFNRTFFPGQAPGPVITAKTPPQFAPEVQFSRSGEGGRFVFRNLKPGSYRMVAASADGAFNPTAYAQRDPGGNGILLNVAEGQSIRNVRMEMAMTGVITGRVLDGDGRPQTHAPVYAVFEVWLGQRVQFLRQTVLTDEEGVYRLFWLAPGKYYIGSRMEDSDRSSLPTFVSLPGRTMFVVASGAPSFYRRVSPDGTLADEMHGLVYYGDVTEVEEAKPVYLQSGGQVAGIDINVSAGITTGRHIRGVLINAATGNPANGVQVRALRIRSTIANTLVPVTTDTNGAFDLTGLTPGRYAVITPYIRNTAAPVSAGAAEVTAPETIAYMEVEVGNADINDLRLVATHPRKTTGRVTFDSLKEDRSADLAKIRVSLGRVPNWLGQSPTAPPNSGAANGLVDTSGNFAIWTSPGVYLVDVSGLPQTTYVKSIRWGQQAARTFTVANERLDPIEILIGTDMGQVTGTVMNGPTPMVNAFVVITPEALESRALPLGITTTANTDANGKFSFPSLRPGRYKVFAWEYIEYPVRPEVMQTYEGSGKAVFVSEGTRQDIRIDVLPRPK
jgi:hypothetical protein